MGGALLSGRAGFAFTPSESRPGELRYCVYKNRYAALAHTTVADADASMPAAERRQPYLPDNPEYTGYEGMITSTAEIDRIAQPLRTAPPAPDSASVLV